VAAAAEATAPVRLRMAVAAAEATEEEALVAAAASEVRLRLSDRASARLLTPRPPAGDRMGDLGSGLKAANFDALPRFDKNFYTENPAVTRRSEEENERFRKENSIVVRPPPPPLLRPRPAPPIATDACPT
jgi:hypothetical protein